MTLRVVLDTSVIISAFRSRLGASRQLLNLVAARRLTPLVTTALFLEYEDVLKRPEQRAASALSLTDIDSALSAFAGFSEPVDIQFNWRPQLRDPDDEMVLEAAINGHADALVTHNIVDFVNVPGRFGLKIIRPGRLCEEMKT